MCGPPPPPRRPPLPPRLLLQLLQVRAVRGPPGSTASRTCTCWGPDKRRGRGRPPRLHFAHPPRTRLRWTSHRLLARGVPLEGDTCHWLPQGTRSLELAHAVPVPSVLAGWGHLPEDCRVPIRRTFSRFPWTLACPCGPVLGGTALHVDRGRALAQRPRVPCPAAQPRAQKRPQEDCPSTHLLPRKQPRRAGCRGGHPCTPGTPCPRPWETGTSHQWYCPPRGRRGRRTTKEERAGRSSRQKDT